MKIQIATSTDVIDGKLIITERFYDGELDSKIKNLEDNINKSLLKLIEEHKVYVLVEAIKYHPQIELTVVVDNNKSIF